MRVCAFVRRVELLEDEISFVSQIDIERKIDGREWVGGVGEREREIDRERERERREREEIEREAFWPTLSRRLLRRGGEILLAGGENIICALMCLRPSPASGIFISSGPWKPYYTMVAPCKRTRTTNLRKLNGVVGKSRAVKETRGWSCLVFQSAVAFLSKLYT